MNRSKRSGVKTQQAAKPPSIVLCATQVTFEPGLELETSHVFSQFQLTCVCGRLEKDKGNLCKWVGELYLELHQGTFTTQSEIKRRNSQMEVLLRAAEFYLAVSHLIGGIKHIQVRCSMTRHY